MFRETLSLFVCLLLPSMVRGQADTTSTYMQTSTMKEVEITAPKILVVQRGDTIVYNADLIQLMIPVGQFLYGCSIGGKEFYSSGLSTAVGNAIQEVIARRTATNIQAPLSLSSKSVNSKFYDLSGRRLNSSHPIRRGAYIIDGKKVVVR